MRSYLHKVLTSFVLFLFPAVFLVAFYTRSDPFQVVKKYGSFSYFPVEPNRDFVSTENYLSKSINYNYNSFIFGSSRATSFKVDSWKEYLDSTAVPFAFDASGESLFGIYTKLRFLDKENAKIENALIILCRDGFSKLDNHNDRLGIKHPEVSGESWSRFHMVNFKSFCTLEFIIGYYSFYLTGKENSFTRGIIQNRGIDIDSVSNQVYLSSWDEQLRKNPKEYYDIRGQLFYQRIGERTESVSRMGLDHIVLLNEIKKILLRHNTNYKVILSPVYDQVRFAIEDKAILQNIFGDQLYDFTGRNFITESDTNWYEPYHFRPFIADTIMRIIYSNPPVGKLFH